MVAEPCTEHRSAYDSSVSFVFAMFSGASAAQDRGASCVDLNANVDRQMQSDVDAHAASAGMPISPFASTAAPGATTLPSFDTNAMQQLMHAHFQEMMQQMMKTMTASFLPSGASGSNPGGIQSAPKAASGGHLANLRSDERAFRRIDRFSNKREEWREWRTHLLIAVRECDKSFADSIVTYEKSDVVIEDKILTPTMQ